MDTAQVTRPERLDFRPTIAVLRMTSEPTHSDKPKTPDLRSSRHALMAEAFETFASGMGPFIDERMQDYFPEETSWEATAANRMGRPAEHGSTDPLFQLLVLRRFWGPVFREFFGDDLRKLIDQLIEARNFWAHLNLPDDSTYLDRILLSIERVLAPVSPETVGSLRTIRAQLKNPLAGDNAEDKTHAVNAAALRLQLGESEAAFAALQDRQRALAEKQSELAKQLETSRRASAGKQHRLSELELELLEASGRSEVLESYLQAERDTRYRLEWLFVGFIAAMLLVMIILAS